MRKSIYNIIYTSVLLMLIFGINFTYAHYLGYGLYLQDNNLLPTIKPFYTNANASSVLIDDAYSPLNTRAYLSYYDKPEAFPRMILANNYSELTSSGYNQYINNVALAEHFNFSSSDYIAYDSEDWDLTPIAEQQQQATYAQLSCEYVHDAGYKFAFTPEIDTPGWGQFNEIDWGCVDFLDLQEQFLSNNPTSLVKNVTSMLSVAKGANPNLIVFVQLDLEGDSTSGSLADIESESLDLSQLNGVNGVIIQDLCDTSTCNNTLTTAINYMKGLNNPDNSTISTTTSTSTSTSSTSTILLTSSSILTTIPITTIRTTSTTIAPIINNTTSIYTTTTIITTSATTSTTIPAALTNFSVNCFVVLGFDIC